MSFDDILQDPGPATPPGCPECWGGGGVDVIKAEFTYCGASRDLGVFIVRNARVRECPVCKEVRFLRSESRKWEEERRVELRMAS